eukprot:TRINITY_DN1319_c0_g2_i3.p1 TRINITY_DN1319_c0_g2~~TRINITY_DN1319_c0_g2_i3.p1  ORF type:complete len:221 (-),score=42.26 TRINITY_DN1319_c0_g2_i3:100-762(-)
MRGGGWYLSKMSYMQLSMFLVGYLRKQNVAVLRLMERPIPESTRDSLLQVLEKVLAVTTEKVCSCFTFRSETICAHVLSVQNNHHGGNWKSEISKPPMRPNKKRKGDDDFGTYVPRTTPAKRRRTNRPLVRARATTKVGLATGDVCSVCKREWTDVEEDRLGGLQCHICSKWVHRTCDPVLQTAEMDYFNQPQVVYYCLSCIRKKRNNRIESGVITDPFK